MDLLEREVLTEIKAIVFNFNCRMSRLASSGRLFENFFTFCDLLSVWKEHDRMAMGRNKIHDNQSRDSSSDASGVEYTKNVFKK
jgi:hypothetical protein